MSKSFRVVISIDGRTLKEVRFSVGSEDSAAEIKSVMDDAFDGLWCGNRISALIWAGVKIDLYSGSLSHSVESASESWRWVVANK